jgi:hypothetical protein
MYLITFVELTTTHIKDYFYSKFGFYNLMSDSENQKKLKQVLNVSLDYCDRLDFTALYTSQDHTTSGHLKS